MEPDVDQVTSAFTPDGVIDPDEVGLRLKLTPIRMPPPE